MTLKKLYLRRIFNCWKDNNAQQVEKRLIRTTTTEKLAISKVDGRLRITTAGHTLMPSRHQRRDNSKITYKFNTGTNKMCKCNVK